MTILAVLGNMIRWEWFRLRRRTEFWVILGLLALAVVGTLAVSAGVLRLIQSGFSIPPYGYPMLVFELLSRLGPFWGSCWRAWSSGVTMDGEPSARYSPGGSVAGRC